MLVLGVGAEESRSSVVLQESYSRSLLQDPPGLQIVPNVSLFRLPRTSKDSKISCAQIGRQRMYTPPRRCVDQSGLPTRATCCTAALEEHRARTARCHCSPLHPSTRTVIAPPAPPRLGGSPPCQNVGYSHSMTQRREPCPNVCFGLKNLSKNNC